MAITRAAVIKNARSYVGTPFIHQGRIRGKALDCVGLVLCTLEDLELMGASKTDASWTRLPEYMQYGPMPVRGKVFDNCMLRLQVKDRSEIRPGDVLSLRVPSEPCHVAVVSELNGVLYMIHAYNGGQCKCIEHVLDRAWQRRIAGVFSIPGVTD